MQAYFDKISLQGLPKIMQAIELAKELAQEFEANQMRCFALRAMGNSKKAIDDMSCDEIDKFSSDLIEIFKYKNWL